MWGISNTFATCGGDHKGVSADVVGPRGPPNIFAPDHALLGDEMTHQRNARFVLKHLHGNAARPKEIFVTHEGLVLADHWRKAINARAR